MNSQHTLVAREGWLLILIVALIATLVYFFAGPIIALPFILLSLLFIFLFRDPPRIIPAAALGIVSPVDGTIVVIEEVHDNFLDRKAVHFTIKMNWNGIFSTRSPVEGKVINQWSGESLKEMATTPTNINSKSAHWIQTDEGDDIIVCMQNDKIMRRAGCMAQTGERIGQGQRCGFIHFGANVELLIPINSRINVKKGSKVLAGSDILATLVHK